MLTDSLDIIDKKEIENYIHKQSNKVSRTQSRQRNQEDTNDSSLEKGRSYELTNEKRLLRSKSNQLLSKDIKKIMAYSQRKKKMIKILFPIKDEETNQIFIDKEVYKQTYKKCHQNLNEMRIDSKKGKMMLSKYKLGEVIKDIHAIRTGNYFLR